MPDPAPRLEDLLAEAHGDADLTTPELERIEAALKCDGEIHRTPWFLQPFVFAGALLAGAMLTIGLVIAFDLHLDSSASLAMGTAYLAIAVALHRLGNQAFVEHLALSCSIGGHAFMLIGAAHTADREFRELAVLLTATLLCVTLYGVYRSFLHRCFACSLVFGVAKLTLPEIDAGDALHPLVGGAAAVCGWILTRRYSLPTWRPLAYACALGLFGMLLPISDRGLWFDEGELPHAYIASSICSLALLWALQFACRRSGFTPRPSHQILAIALAIALAALSTPGIPAALFLVVLGHASHHWPLTALGLAGLPLLVWNYYYKLDLDFMSKSGVLAGSGALLLLARWLLLRPDSQPQREAP